MSNSVSIQAKAYMPHFRSRSPVGYQESGPLRMFLAWWNLPAAQALGRVVLGTYISISLMYLLAAGLVLTASSSVLATTNLTGSYSSVTPFLYWADYPGSAAYQSRNPAWYGGRVFVGVGRAQCSPVVGVLRVLALSTVLTWDTPLFCISCADVAVPTVTNGFFVGHWW